jgi:hypothetical protein
MLHALTTDDSAKTMVVRGLSALRVGALIILGRL